MYHEQQGGHMLGVDKFYPGRTILITGVTGFLGKMLLECLLRTQPEIKKFILVIRDKVDRRSGKKTPAKERLQKEVLCVGLFDTLRKLWGDDFEQRVMSKCECIHADVSQINLGLSDEEAYRVANEIDVFFHSAASTSFDERPDTLLKSNTLATEWLLEFARLGLRLDHNRRQVPVFCDVSTCFTCGMAEGYSKEEVHPMPFDPEQEIEEIYAMCSKWDNDHVFKGKGEPTQRHISTELSIMGVERANNRGWWDTYTFAKCISEQLFVKKRGNIPACIVRPAICEGTYLKPEPGWLEGFRVMEPMAVGYFKRQLHDWCTQPHSFGEVIPSDFVIHTMVCAVVRAYFEDSSEMHIYQCGNGSHNAFNTGFAGDCCRQFDETVDPYGHNAKGNFMLPWRYPTPAQFINNIYWTKEIPLLSFICALWPLQLIPPLGKMYKTYRQLYTKLGKVSTLVGLYAPYSNWYVHYCQDHQQEMWALLSDDEKDRYPFDVRGIDWNDYFCRVHFPTIVRRLLNLEIPNAQTPHGMLAINIPQTLARTAAVHPEAVGMQLRMPSGQWLSYTYRELLQMTSEMAGTLRQLGVSPGTRLLLWAPNGPEWMCAFYAALALEAVLVPVDWESSAEDVSYLHHYTSCTLVMTSADGQALLSPTQTGSLNLPPSLLDIGAGCRPFGGAAHRSAYCGPEEWTQAYEIPAMIYFPSTVGLAMQGGVEPRGLQYTSRNLFASMCSSYQAFYLRESHSTLALRSLHFLPELLVGGLVPVYLARPAHFVRTASLQSFLSSPEFMSVLREGSITHLVGDAHVVRLLSNVFQQHVSGLTASLGSTLKRWTGSSYLTSRASATLRVSLTDIICAVSESSVEMWDFFAGLDMEYCEGLYCPENTGFFATNMTAVGQHKRGSVGGMLSNSMVRIENKDSFGNGIVSIAGSMLASKAFPETAASKNTGVFELSVRGRIDENGFLFLQSRPLEGGSRHLQKPQLHAASPAGSKHDKRLV